jgi:hypothetical protein
VNEPVGGGAGGGAPPIPPDGQEGALDEVENEARRDFETGCAPSAIPITPPVAPAPIFKSRRGPRAQTWDCERLSGLRNRQRAAQYRSSRSRATHDKQIDELLLISFAWLDPRG